MTNQERDRIIELRLLRKLAKEVAKMKFGTYPKVFEAFQAYTK
jgi:hypothetical protein